MLLWALHLNPIMNLHWTGPWTQEIAWVLKALEVVLTLLFTGLFLIETHTNYKQATGWLSRPGKAESKRDALLTLDSLGISVLVLALGASIVLAVLIVVVIGVATYAFSKGVVKKAKENKPTLLSLLKEIRSWPGRQWSRARKFKEVLTTPVTDLAVPDKHQSTG